MSFGKRTSESIDLEDVHLSKRSTLTVGALGVLITVAVGAVTYYNSASRQIAEAMEAQIREHTQHPHPAAKDYTDTKIAIHEDRDIDKSHPQVRARLEVVEKKVEEVKSEQKEIRSDVKEIKGLMYRQIRELRRMR